ncbi:phage related protein [Bartonella grahamii as4aup]|uniref:Phage related protein n=2 Tax=Bartonella grahamii TaxID=33045 RepID=C6AA85_BARGA|nr:phage related protein [Bartonella grahamii as4aup]ACS51736.1 phage related protein [Bartonella grahamii as4aup]ACS51825.1 phage related protein [Bartonella grahamii as4aup]
MLMQKKFALTNETRVFGNHTLYRIQALKDFADIKAGTLGGFIEKESNLSHDGNCWVYDEALVFKNGHVYENARVFGKAIIYDNAYVYDNARVYENARIANNVHVFENANIHGIAVIRENVGGSTKIKTYTERLSPYGELEIVYVSPKIKQHK